MNAVCVSQFRVGCRCYFSLRKFTNISFRTKNIQRYRHSMQTFRSLSRTSTLLADTKKRISLIFEQDDGTRYTVEGKIDETILDVVKNNNLDIQGYGACDGTLSCSTCHIMFTPEDYKKLSYRTVEELDVLDLAEELGDTSRLGCQVLLTEVMDGMVIKIPKDRKDIRGDGLL